MKGIQHNYGSYTSEFASDFPNFFQQYFPAQQHHASNQSAPSNSFQQHNSSGTIIGRIGSPASAFCATEIAMGLSHYDLPESCSQQSKNLYAPFHQSGNTESTARNQFSTLSEREQILHLKHKLLGDLDDSDRGSPFASFDANHDHEVLHNPYAPHVVPMKQFGRPINSSAAVSSHKARIRWTQDLHDRFVECVNRLGGPESVEAAAGKAENQNNTNRATQFDIKTGVHLKEALQLQLDVQRRLHEQLEIQRNLQIRIEEQSQQLKMMLDKQEKTSADVTETKYRNNKCGSGNANSRVEDGEVVVIDDDMIS